MDCRRKALDEEQGVEPMRRIRVGEFQKGNKRNDKRRVKFGLVSDNAINSRSTRWIVNGIELAKKSQDVLIADSSFGDIFGRRERDAVLKRTELFKEIRVLF